jgi:hypothetical protein
MPAPGGLRRADFETTRTRAIKKTGQRRTAVHGCLPDVAEEIRPFSVSLDMNGS